MGVLLKFRIPGIQSYIFQTQKLREIRGASALVEDLSGTAMRRAIEAAGGNIWYLAAGHGVVQAQDHATAQKVLTVIENQVTGTTVILTPQFATAPLGSHPQSGQILKQLDHDLRHQVPKPVPFQPLHTVLRNCQSCQRYPMAHQRSHSDERICAVCQKKYQRLAAKKRLPYWEKFADYINAQASSNQDIRQSAWNRWVNASQNGTQWEKDLLADDLNALSQHSLRHGYVALIYADANHLGDFFENTYGNLGRYGDNLSGAANELEAVSRKVIETMRQATYAAILRTWPLKVGDADRTLPKSLPFEILYLGGDDLLLVCAADKGPDFALALADAFRECCKANDLPLSLGTGLVLAKAHTPMAALIDHAKAVMASAKKYGFQRQRRTEQMPLEQGYAIDVSLLTETSVLDLEEARQQAVSGGQPLRLSTLPHGREEFEKFLKSLKSLGKSRLRAIRFHPVLTACRRSRLQGTVAAQALLGRMDHKERTASETMFRDASETLADSGEQSWIEELPWLVRNRQTCTVLGDFLDLAPFLEGKGGMA